MKSTLRKISIALASVGPGLFLIGYNIGTGSVTTMAQTGANHGMSLFWALVLSCVFTFVLSVAYGRHSIVSGKTALYSLRSEFRYGWIPALYILIAVIIGEFLALGGIMGIVADLIQAGLMIGFGKEVGTFWIILTLSALMCALLLKGRYRQIEKILTVFVIMMALSFLTVFVLVRPDLSEVFTGMIPNIEYKPGTYGLIAAMAGTTCSAAVFVVRSTVVAEKGWTRKDLKTEKKDSFVSASMMLVISGLIMAVAAGTLHKMGLTVHNTMDLVHLFEPLGGKVAVLILLLGVASAGLSTIFPIVLIAPWLIADFNASPRDIRSPMFRILIFVGFAFAFGSVFLNERPTALMIFSQAFQACILPAVAISMFVLLNRKRTMGKYTAGKKFNAAMIAVIIFSAVTTGFAIAELVVMMSQ